jgi:SAM-dependent methyltransferase
MRTADSADPVPAVKDSSTIAVCAACASVGAFEPALRKDGYDILRCPCCGIGRAVVPAFTAEALYTDDYFTGKVRHAYVDYASSENILRQEFRRQLPFLRDFVPGGKLLEIGCAYGFFLQEAKHFFDVYGVEISEGAVEFCRRSGLSNVWQAPLTEELARNIGELDAIVLLDVIEHIDDIVGTLTLAISRLRPGGVVLLTTGDWNSFVARTTGASWRLMAPPHHLWYFTRTSLRRLFGRLGCLEEHFSHPWKLVPLELIVDQLGTMIGHPMALPKPLRGIGLPANLFDAMRLVYRKVAAPSGSRPKID